MNLIKSELRKVGASEREIADLAKIAGNIRKIKVNGLSQNTKDSILGVVGEAGNVEPRARAWVISSFATAACAVALIATHVFSTPPKEPMTQQDGTPGIGADSDNTTEFIGDPANKMHQNVNKIEEKPAQTNAKETPKSSDDKKNDLNRNKINDNNQRSTRDKPSDRFWFRLYDNDTWDWLNIDYDKQQKTRNRR